MQAFNNVCRMEPEALSQGGECAVSQRTIEGVAQVAEPGGRGGACGDARRSDALILAHATVSLEEQVARKNGQLRQLAARAGTLKSRHCDEQ